MFRTLISVAAACAALAGLCLVAPVTANAQTFTFSNPNCTGGYALSGPVGTQVLTCVTGSGAPTGCSIQGPGSAIIGQTITLNAVCIGGAAATQWTWSGGSCLGQTTQSCPANESSAGLRTYGVTAGNLSGNGSPVTANVNWTLSAVAPSGCTLTPTNTNLAVGGNVTLTALCTSGTLPISFALTGGAFGGMTGTQSSANVGAQIIANVTAATTVGGTATNAAGPASLSSASITVQTGGGGFANCTSQGLTPIPAGGINVDWGTAPSLFSSSSGNFGDGTKWVWLFKITPPAGTPTTSLLGMGRFVVSEFGQTPTDRQMSISTTPCDFRRTDLTGLNNGPLAQIIGQTASLMYGVNAPNKSWAGMTAGTTYYVSVRNYKATGITSCSSSSCNALMNVAPPQ